MVFSFKSYLLVIYNGYVTQKNDSPKVAVFQIYDYCI